MSDILTESFCERCGTEYTFGQVDDRRRSFARLATVARGVRNYVLSNDPLSTAFARARQEDVAELLDAFDRTFHFCIECRQYACLQCWNEEAGRCQTCAPLHDALGTEIEVAAAPAEAAAAPAEAAAALAEQAPDTGGEVVAASGELPEQPEGPREPEGFATAPSEDSAPQDGQLAVATMESAEEGAQAVPVTVAPVEEALEEELAPAGQVVVVDVPAPLDIRQLPVLDVTSGQGADPSPSPETHPPQEASPLSDSVAARPKPAPGTCPACGLSVSRAARFCRRCGTPQAEEARATL